MVKHTLETIENSWLFVLFDHFYCVDNPTLLMMLTGPNMSCNKSDLVKRITKPKVFHYFKILNICMLRKTMLIITIQSVLPMLTKQSTIIHFKNESLFYLNV